MSKHNIPLESNPKGITRSQAEQDSQLAKIVGQNRKGCLKIKPLRNREYLADNQFQNIPDPIPTEQELYNTFNLEDSSLFIYFFLLTRRKNCEFFYRRCTGLSQDGSRHT